MPKWCSVPQRNTHIMSFSYFMFLGAFNVIQNFATTLDPKLGSLSVALIYITWIIMSLTFTKSFVNCLTPKYSMVVGTILYGLYSISSIFIIVPIYIIASILVGIGAGLVWIGQGISITKFANEQELLLNKPVNSLLGTFNGIFGVYTNFNYVIGNLVGGLIFQFDGSVDVLYVVMSVVSFIGSGLLLFISQSKEVINDSGNDGNNRIISDIKNVFSLWKDIKLWCLMPITIHWGLEVAFLSGDYAALIEDKATKFYMLTIFGFVASLTCVIIGKLSDIGQYNTLICLLFGQLSLLSVFIIFYFWNINQTGYHMWILLVSLLGIGHGIYWSLIPKIYPIIFNSKNTEIFLNQKLIQALGSFTGFIYYAYTTFHFRIIFNMTFIIIGSILILSNPVKNILIQNIEIDNQNENETKGANYVHDSTHFLTTKTATLESISAPKADVLQESTSTLMVKLDDLNGKYI